jgi:hypothetical protein
MAVAAAHGALGKRNVAAARRAFAEQKRSAGGRIDFHLVMHLQNFDVPVRPKRRGGALDQRGKQVHPETHIAGADDHRVTCGGVDLFQIGWRQSRRANNVNDARLRRERSKLDARSRCGEVDNAIGIDDGLQRVVGDRHANRRQAGHHARILAERIAAGSLQRRGNRNTGHFPDRAHKHPAHAAGRAHDDEPHVGHSAPLF